MGGKILLRMMAEEAATKVVDESVLGVREVVGKFAGNYTKWRNVGYGVIDSASGSFNETRKYYSDILAGREPFVMTPAIYFEN